MKTNEYSHTGKAAARQITTSSSEVLTFSFGAGAGTIGFISVNYFGPNKEYMGIFPVTVVNSLSFGEGAAIIQKAFNSVSCSVNVISQYSVELTFGNGVAGAKVDVGFIHF